jgi:hypothetical protein
MKKMHENKQRACVMTFLLQHPKPKEELPHSRRPVKRGVGIGHAPSVKPSICWINRLIL